MAKVSMLLAAAVLGAAALPGRAAEPVMVQCGREYRAARSGGTLNGADWDTYRAACAGRLKATPAAVSAPPVAPPGAPIIAAAQAPAASAPPPAAAPSAGMAAMHARQKQCGAEWTAGKAALVARTPGLTWPTYWSQCNTRIKATGR